MDASEHQRVEQCRVEVDVSLKNLQDAHGEMKQMLTDMTQESSLLANDIGAAVRGLQFQDRTGQQIAHVVEDLETVQTRLASRFGEAGPGEVASDAGFSSYTMQEEREVAGIYGTESTQGDVELF
jgi:chemotaxis regulatin CheY-phosphate phosphatase CheZ